jgi:hypothetical protein
MGAIIALVVFKTSDFTQNPVVSEMAMFRQQGHAAVPDNLILGKATPL